MIIGKNLSQVDPLPDSLQPLPESIKKDGADNLDAIFDLIESVCIRR